MLRPSRLRLVALGLVVLLGGWLAVAHSQRRAGRARRRPPDRIETASVEPADARGAPSGAVAERARDGDVEGITLPAYARFGDGFVVWESRRSGSWRIWTRRLDGSGLARLTPEEAGRQHCCAHIAPDGASVVYLSQEGGDRRYEDAGPGTLHRIDPDGGNDRVLAPGALAYTSGHRAVVWRSPGELIYIDAARATILLDLASGRTRKLAEADSRGRPWLLDPTLRFATDDPLFAPYDAATGRVGSARLYGGCEPYFSSDGEWGFWNAGAGGPVNRIDLRTAAVSTVIEKNDRRLHGDKGYIYFPMFSRAGDLFAFAASANVHDHFRADYDVFVAESDPRTLELLGDPVRYTSDPGSDRYPDVFRAPLALGRHSGEAPFTVRLAAPPPADGWRFEWGDGETGDRDRAEHTYARPGGYDVRAVREGREARGRVEVRAALPPRPVETAVRGDRVVVVGFDEDVDVADARAAFGSGRAVRGLAAEGGRSLVITLTAPIADRDTLSLQGVRDRAQRPNEMFPAALAVDPPTWPSNRDRLVFLWQSADQPDRAGGSVAGYRLEAKGGAVLDRDRTMVPAGGFFAAPEELSARLAEQAVATNALTVQMTITPAARDAPEPGVVVSFSPGRPPFNFQLVQEREQLLFQVRRAKAGDERPIRIGKLPGTDPVHVVVAYEVGRTLAWIDGRKTLDSADLQGDFFHWRPAPLTFGGEGGRKRTWRGRIEGVALYNRRLDDAEVAEDLRRYRAIRAARPVVPALEVEGRLVARSRPPTLSEITPYHEALEVAEYEVERVLAGVYDKPRLRVARWSILDDRSLEEAAVEVGSTARLRLEPFARNPQLESVYIADTLPPEFDLPLFYEVRF